MILGFSPPLQDRNVTAVSLVAAGLTPFLLIPLTLFSACTERPAGLAPGRSAPSWIQTVTKVPAGCGSLLSAPGRLAQR